MRKTLAVLALSVATQAAVASPFSISVTGTFQSAPTEDLYNPASGNFLAPLLGSTFTGGYTWEDNPVGIAAPPPYSPYYTQVDPATGDRGWAFFSPSYPTFTVPGIISYVGQNVVIGTTNNLSYDGSQGFLPAGTYDQVSIGGWQFDRPCGDLFSCPPGTAIPPQNRHLEIVLIGASDLLADGDTLPGPNLDFSKVQFAFATYDRYDGLNHLIGRVETWGTVTGTFESFTIGAAAVPEPATLALALAGLGLIGFARRGKSRRTPAQ